MTLDKQDHSSLVLWAADCAERVLQYRSGAWVRGEIAGR